MCRIGTQGAALLVYNLFLHDDYLCRGTVIERRLAECIDWESGVAGRLVGEHFGDFSCNVNILGSSSR